MTEVKTPNYDPIDTVEFQARDAAHHLHPFTDYAGLAEEGTRIVTRAEGSVIHDSTGKRLLDGMAGLWCVNIGYGRRELADVAYRQMLDLPYYNTFFKSTTPPATRLAEKLAELAPTGLTKVFFNNSGSEANDTLVRLIRHYWNVMERPAKKHIISRHMAYHGSTVAAASIGGMAAMHGQADLPLPGFHHIDPPYHYRDGQGMTEAVFAKHAADLLEAKIQALGPDNVAAFFGEPVMGAGGVIVAPEGYWERIQEICRKHEVLLVADEVICGFGRTGRWFGSQTLGIEPDMMPIAKGLSSGYQPISACLVHERIANAVGEHGEFFHGYTYSGHPVACAVALENIRIIEEEGLVERVRGDIGPYFQKKLHEMADHRLVGQVQGLGLLGAMELVADKKTATPFRNVGTVGTMARDHSLDIGLVMRAVGDRLVLSPPLVITRAEVDELFEKARMAIDRTAADLGR
ncbi:MAG: aspartate aminotransferase family protein [Alphaproteobacteria bacterium]|nr:aspartate aminotransferase family protein [Alphaproteobacteria bacterium]